MNNLLTYILLSTFCVFGTKLKTVESSFTEVIPGIVSGDIVTKFDIKIQSTGNKKITIDAVWIKNKKAKWKLIDSSEKTVESINDKSIYSLKGEIRKRADGKPGKMSLEKEASRNYDEEVVIIYKLNSSDKLKTVVIDKIENMKTLRKM